MQWEPWIETAVSYKELSESLRSRGYTNIPMSPSTMIDLRQMMVAAGVNKKRLPNQKIMLRKNKD